MGLFAGKRPGDLGVRDGKLKPPPASPNCVSSQASGGYHAIAPLAYRGSAETAMKALADIVRATPRTNIVSQTHDYLYAEYQSALVGFVDDVEFWFPPGGQIIHVRSASRLGHSDLGANRKRIEDVRTRLGAAGV
ncbi:MAG: DUF1499 domain-containing protein [Gemmatimonadota bacterium]